MSAKFHLNKAVTGFLKEQWVCNSTEPFPAYSGYACSLKTADRADRFIVMAATEDEVMSICQQLTPEGEINRAHIRPVVLTHQQNVKLIDDEL